MPPFYEIPKQSIKQKFKKSPTDFRKVLIFIVIKEGYSNFR